MPFLLLLCAACARVFAADGNVVLLPPFIVDDPKRAWLYTEGAGREVLSECDERTTRRVIETQVRLMRLLAEVLPESLQHQFSVPMCFLLFERESPKAASQDLLSRLLGGRAASRYRVLPNIRLSDSDAVVFLMIAGARFREDQVAPTLEHVRWLMQSRVPALPGWFATGLQSLFQDLRFQGNELLLKPMGWISVGQMEELRDDRQNTVALTPLLDLFSGVPPTGMSAKRRWQAQAELFVRWALCGERRAHREALWRFVEGAASAGFSEPLFRDCFGLSIADAERAVSEYTPVAVLEAQHFRPTIAAPPPMVLRAASAEEIARIRGEFERLGYLYVKRVAPEIAEGYLDQARRTLRLPLGRGQADARLLAALGLCEVDAGSDPAARTFLEAAAAQTQELRPRAAFELARLRYGEMRENRAPGVRLAADQMAAVLAPLFMARAQQPPMAPVYDLIAEVWFHGEVTPGRAHLAVIDEGVRLFPQRVQLAFRGAELNLRHGFRAEASSLIAHGLRIADDEPTRGRFLELQDRFRATGVER